MIAVQIPINYSSASVTMATTTTAASNYGTCLGAQEYYAAQGRYTMGCTTRPYQPTQPVKKQSYIQWDGPRRPKFSCEILEEDA
jgi:hypothetical protein